MRTEAIYGAPPVDLGLIDLSPSEMMFWQYCPIKLPAADLMCLLPPNLKQFSPIVSAVFSDFDRGRRIGEWQHSYVYLTAKTMWVTPENPGNRPGWHSDGFLTDDINYVWSDTSPTVYWQPEMPVDFEADHSLSLYEMRACAEHDITHHVRYPTKHLLRLNERAIHKVDTCSMGGMRSFVKVSVSRHKYALLGNSINHALAPDWTYSPRSVERNCPIGSVAAVLERWMEG